VPHPDCAVKSSAWRLLAPDPGAMQRACRTQGMTEELDGRWIAEIPQLPGALCYGRTVDDAMAKAEVLALRAMADRLEQNESRPVEINIDPASTRLKINFTDEPLIARKRLDCADSSHHRLGFSAAH